MSAPSPTARPGVSASASPIPRVAIVGGGFAGIAVALRLLETRSQGRVGLGPLGAPLAGKALVAPMKMAWKSVQLPRRASQDPMSRLPGKPSRIF